jgi:hypothetical protein
MAKASEQWQTAETRSSVANGDEMVLLEDRSISMRLRTQNYTLLEQRRNQDNGLLKSLFGIEEPFR